MIWTVPVYNVVAYCGTSSDFRGQSVAFCAFVSPASSAAGIKSWVCAVLCATHVVLGLLLLHTMRVRAMRFFSTH